MAPLPGACSQSSWWNSIVSKFLCYYWAIDNQILQASLERGGKVGTALLIPIWFVLTPVPLNRVSMPQKASRARRDHLGVAGGVILAPVVAYALAAVGISGGVAACEWAFRLPKEIRC